MKTFKIITAILGMVGLLQASTAQAQMSEYKFGQLFDKAFGMVVDGDYTDAENILFQLHRADREHAQVAYLLGMCRVKTGQTDGITSKLLRSAAKGYNYYHQHGRVEDRTAPAKVWFYLAQANAEQRQFDNAIEAYRNYMSCIPLASIDHKRQIVFAIRELRNQKIGAAAGVVSDLASRKP